KPASLDRDAGRRAAASARPWQPGDSLMKATPFLMFQGDAKPALALYREAFPDYEELLLQEHSSGPQQGQIAMARIRVGGLEVMLYDSAPIHAFSFTPSTSTFVECDNEAQLRTLAKKLADGG